MDLLRTLDRGGIETGKKGPLTACDWNAARIPPSISLNVLIMFGRNHNMATLYKRFPFAPIGLKHLLVALGRMFQDESGGVPLARHLFDLTFHKPAQKM